VTDLKYPIGNYEPIIATTAAQRQVLIEPAQPARTPSGTGFSGTASE
jgi:hypothetical protein